MQLNKLHVKPICQHPHESALVCYFSLVMVDLRCYYSEFINSYCSVSNVSLTFQAFFHRYCQFLIHFYV